MSDNVCSLSASSVVGPSESSNGETVAQVGNEEEEAGEAKRGG